MRWRAKVERARDLLLGCAAITPGILHFSVGTATPGMDCTADLVLDSTFTDAEALAAYQHHSTHVAIKPFMKAVVQSRHCMDFVVPDNQQ